VAREPGEPRQIRRAEGGGHAAIMARRGG
jgi:hypothetical protein